MAFGSTRDLHEKLLRIGMTNGEIIETARNLERSGVTVADYLAAGDTTAIVARALADAARESQQGSRSNDSASEALDVAEALFTAVEGCLPGEEVPELPTLRAGALLAQRLLTAVEERPLGKSREVPRHLIVAAATMRHYITENAAILTREEAALVDANNLLAETDEELADVRKTLADAEKAQTEREKVLDEWRRWPGLKKLQERDD